MSFESRTQPSSERVSGHEDTTSATSHSPDTSSLPNEGAVEAALPNQPTAVAGGGLLLIGVTLAAANMRPAVTSMASMLGEVRDSIGATSTWASVVTAVPTLCFGVAGLLAPFLARRWGISRTLGVSLAVLTVAMLARVATAGPGAVLAGTVLVCAAIAMCNVLVPVVVKDSFPGRVGMATSFYTTAMAVGGSVGSTVTPWVNMVTGSWQLALAMWAIVALAALLVWGPATRKQPRSVVVSAAGEAGPRRSMARSPIAWAVTGYFALQSLFAYVVMGWLPEVFQGAGMDDTTAGALLGFLLLIGVPMSTVLPPLVTRRQNQSGWAVVLALIALSGLFGLWQAPTAAPILWAFLIGVGMSGFPLALVFISLRTRNAADTGKLSAMAQSVGYLIASIGPLAFGLLHDVTGGWSMSLILLLVVVTIQGVVGMIAGRPRQV